QQRDAHDVHGHPDQPELHPALGHAEGGQQAAHEDPGVGPDRLVGAEHPEDRGEGGGAADEHDDQQGAGAPGGPAGLDGGAVLAPGAAPAHPAVDGGGDEHHLPPGLAVEVHRVRAAEDAAEEHGEQQGVAGDPDGPGPDLSSHPAEGAEQSEDVAQHLSQQQELPALEHDAGVEEPVQEFHHDRSGSGSVGGVAPGELTQGGDLLGGVLGPVDGGAGDEHVRAGLGAALDGLAADAAVDLDVHLEVRLADRGAGAADLREHRLQEALPAEAGLDRHDQQHVELADDVQQRLDGGGGAEGHAGLGVLAAQVAGQLHGGAGGLEVEGHRGGAGLGIGGSLGGGGVDHQVGGDRQGAAADDLLDHGGAEGQGGDEAGVQHD